ncbi:thioredoxin [Novosphingobium sp. ZW T3_23]|uniref:thioredoxin n=1 Tax=Novosphingobium sp. ZW T3_23 TaxID=3378084 RepID=UPI00385338BE
MNLIKDISTDVFEDEVMRSPIPVFIDFHATWCGPCKAIMPMLEDVAREYEGEVRIVKIDIEAEPELATRFGIRAVPTFVLIHKGEEKERPRGILTRGNMSALLEGYLEGGQ